MRIATALVHMLQRAIRYPFAPIWCCKSCRKQKHQKRKHRAGSKMPVTGRQHNKHNRARMAEERSSSSSHHDISIGNLHARTVRHDQLDQENTQLASTTELACTNHVIASIDGASHGVTGLSRALHSCSSCRSFHCMGCRAGNIFDFGLGAQFSPGSCSIGCAKCSLHNWQLGRCSVQRS